MRRYLVAICLVSLAAFGQETRPAATHPPATMSAEELTFGPEESSYERLRQRQEWFVHQRAYPFAHIPAGARLGAIQQFRQMRRLEASQGHPFGKNYLASAQATGIDVASSLQWTQIGPQPSLGYWGISSGRATSVAVDPTNPEIAYLGTAGGGVWKTTDGGKNWNPVSDQEVSLAIGSLAIDPSNPLIIYAGTGEQDFSVDSYYGAGILKSTDGGQTWANIQTSFGYPSGGIGAIAIQPGHTNVLLAAAAGSGVQRSTDSGMTWTPVLTGSDATAVVFDPSNGSIAYAGLGAIFGSSKNALYKSTDGGVTWTLLGGGLPPVIGRVGLAHDPATTGVVYAAIADSLSAGPGQTGISGIYKTTNGGTTWSRIYNPANGIGSCCSWYENPVAVDPSNPSVIITGGFGVTRSLDGGATWTDITVGSSGVGVHPDQHSFAFSADGSVLYAANDGGAWSTNSPALPAFAWSSLNSTISTITFYPGLAVDPNNLNNAMGGTQDNSVEAYSGNLQWTDVDYNCGDGSSTSFDPTNTNTAYNYCIGTIYKTSGGGVWNRAMTGIDTVADSGGWVSPLVLDPSKHATLYYAARHVYQSNDGAGSWAQISPALVSGTLFNAIAVAPSNSDVVYVGAGNGNVFVSKNASAGVAATWTQINLGLPARGVTSLAVDFSDPSVAYVTLGGFGTGHVWKTRNSGGSWTDISGNLPSVTANQVIIDPATVNTLYLANDIGVFVTPDGGKTWSTLSQGLPMVVVQSIGVIEKYRVLRALTHGRSTWDLALPAVVPLLSSASSLAFPDQVFNTSSTAMPLTLTNNLTNSISVTSITITGDYTQSNNCGTSLASAATCTVNVTFTPSISGSRTGNLIVKFNSGTAQTMVIALSGNGLSTFAMAAAAPSEVSVVAGKTAGFMLSITPQGGDFNTAIALSCSGLPAKTACSFTPTSVTPGGAVASVTMAISTTATSASPTPNLNNKLLMMFVLGLPMGAMLVVRSRRSAPANRATGSLVLGSLVIMLLLSFTGCGGGGTGGPPPPTPGTTPGKYTVTVTGAAGAQKVSTTVTLDVT